MDKKTKYDIPITDHQFIAWLVFDASKDSVRDISELMQPLNPLFDLLEVNCLRACCGIDAFSFLPVDLKFAIGQLNGIDLDKTINRVIKYCDELEEKVILVKQLNQLCHRDTFVNLLNHIRKQIFR